MLALHPGFLVLYELCNFAYICGCKVFSDESFAVLLFDRPSFVVHEESLFFHFYSLLVVGLSRKCFSCPRKRGPKLHPAVSGNR
jgi:hypothetical protein